MISYIVGRPPNDQYCWGGGGGGGGGVVPRFSSEARRMRGAECCALTTVLLQRAGGRRRRQEEGNALNDGGHPGSFNDKRKISTLLHHLGHQLQLWALTFGVPAMPAVPPPLP